MTFAFVAAGAGFAISAVLIHVAGIGAPSEVAPDLAAGEAEARLGTIEALRRIFAVPALRWTAVVAVALALGFYAQFESGLPAYALTVLDVDESAIGLAAAVNCVVIVALQVVVVRRHRAAQRRQPAHGRRRRLDAVVGRPVRRTAGARESPRRSSSRRSASSPSARRCTPRCSTR